MKLIHGHRYQGLAVLPWPVSSLADEEGAAEYLKARGWVDVATWDDPEKLPKTWPADKRDADVFAKATWGGPTGEVELPRQAEWVVDLGAVPMNSALQAQLAAGRAAYNASKAASGTGGGTGGAAGFAVATSVVGVGLVWWMAKKRKKRP